MQSQLLEFAICGCLGLGALASGLSTTAPVRHGEAVTRLDAVSLDDVLSARLALQGRESFLHRVDVSEDGTISRLEIVFGTRWPWARHLVDTRSVWVTAEKAGYMLDSGLVTIEPGNFDDRQSGRPVHTVNVRAVAPSLLMGSRIDPPGEIDSATVLEIDRPAEGAMTFRVREETLLPWKSGQIVEFTSDCASFRPRDRVIRIGDCPAAA